MGVAPKDHDYFRRIGAAKARSHADAAAEHAARSLDERLEESIRIYRRYRDEAAPRDDDPSPLYERARALGLCRG